MVAIAMPDKFRQNPRTAARIIEGLASVVTPDDNKLHTLNKSASRIWELAAEGSTVEEMASVLVRHYDVTPERARADTERIVADLVARGIFEALP